MTTTLSCATRSSWTWDTTASQSDFLPRSRAVPCNHEVAALPRSHGLQVRHRDHPLRLRAREQAGILTAASTTSTTHSSLLSIWQASTSRSPLIQAAGNAQTLSKAITAEVLGAFRAANIELVRTKFEDPEGIVRSPGTKVCSRSSRYVVLLSGYATYTLHPARPLTKMRYRTFSPLSGTPGGAEELGLFGGALTIGRMLVHAHAANQNVPAAIELCDRRPCYNSRSQPRRARQKSRWRCPRCLLPWTHTPTGWTRL